MLNPLDINTSKAQHWPVDIKAGDILVLLNQQETLIGRLKSVSGLYIELYKPHALIVQPNPNGSVGVGFMPYAELAFIRKRDARWFNLSNFVQVDFAEEKLANNFNTQISGLVAPPRQGVIL